MPQVETATTDIPPEPGGTSEMTDLLFRLDDETFAIPVSAVNEIIDPQRMAPVPNAHPMVPGIINVRGSIIPHFDIRARLNMGCADQMPTTRMIVLEQPGPDGDVMRVAFTADAVERVVDHRAEAVIPLPELGVSWPSDCLCGSYHIEDELVICLNTATVFRIVPVESPRQ